MGSDTRGGRTVKAVHGVKEVRPDADFELGLAEYLRARNDSPGLVELYARFAAGEGDLDARMRRAIWRALARRFGHGVQIGSGAAFKHAETFDIGDGVCIGPGAHLQGRCDGTCVIGKHTWIGPQSFLDARDLVLGEHVGWGPGAKVLGSTHTGLPADVPIIATDLEIKPVRVEDWADIGVNAVLLPGVTVGKGSIVGAGAVVTRDVAPFTVVAGVPARVISTRQQADAA